jgi:hypothetical protein
VMIQRNSRKPIISLCRGNTELMNVRATGTESHEWSSTLLTFYVTAKLWRNLFSLFSNSLQKTPDVHIFLEAIHIWIKLTERSMICRYRDSDGRYKGSDEQAM